MKKTQKTDLITKNGIMIGGGGLMMEDNIGTKQKTSENDVFIILNLDPETYYMLYIESFKESKTIQEYIIEKLMKDYKENNKNERMQLMNEAYKNLQSDKSSWKEELKERDELEGTIDD